MKDERTFILTANEVLHILVEHFCRHGFIKVPEQYNKGIFGYELDRDGKNGHYKLIVFKEDIKTDMIPTTDEKPSRHIDLDKTYTDEQKGDEKCG